MAAVIKSIKMGCNVENPVCFFCKGTKKIKSTAVIVDNGTEKEVPCCNSCAHKYSE